MRSSGFPLRDMSSTYWLRQRLGVRSGIWTAQSGCARYRSESGEIISGLVYPLCSMGAHISDCPNHAVGRITPFATRGHVALAGTFGYELDVTRIPQADRDMIPSQTAMYHKYNDLVRTGDYYRIASYSENRQFDCWEVAAKDGSEVLVTYAMQGEGKSLHISMRTENISMKIKAN